ncbi:unnamed protein product, partial [Nippostrongylus brasiliensis]|uniref:Sushi domain-containing protein n=1 Tax=Nippostrongylus brasiliensis TaxID=27835 RepID=A0A0N4YU12_NIPBR
CSSGQWYPPSLGTCSSIIGGSVGSTCPVLTAPSGGTITFSSGFQGSPAISGTSATLSCPSGVQGASTTYCTNGVWTPATLGTCIGFGGIGGATTTCQAMTTPSGVYLSYSNMATTPPFPSGTTVTARCTSGAAVTGSSIATCLSGAWFPATVGTCGLTSNDPGSTCSNIQAVGGTIDYSDGDFLLSHSPGSTASLLCTGGAPIASSSGAKCSPLDKPTRGTIVYSQSGDTFPSVKVFIFSETGGLPIPIALTIPAIDQGSNRKHLLREWSVAADSFGTLYSGRLVDAELPSTSTDYRRHRA